MVQTDLTHGGGRKVGKGGWVAARQEKTVGRSQIKKDYLN